MRIDRINLSVDTDGKTGKVRSASIYFENLSDLGERVSGQFAITLEEYEMIQREEILPETIAEKKLVELFALQPEEDVTAAFVQLSEDFEALAASTGEMKEQAIQAATMSASTAVEGVRSEAIQAAAQKVDALLPALRKLVRIDELQHGVRHLGSEEALEELRLFSGTLLDPDIVNAFNRLHTDKYTAADVEIKVYSY